MLINEPLPGKLAYDIALALYLFAFVVVVGGLSLKIVGLL